MRAAMNVTTRSQQVHCESHHQQAGRTDVRRLKVPVAWPKPPADRCAGRHGKKEQAEEREDSGVFVTRSGELDVLEHPPIGGEQ